MKMVIVRKPVGVNCTTCHRDVHGVMYRIDLSRLEE